MATQMNANKHWASDSLRENNFKVALNFQVLNEFKKCKVLSK